MMYSKTVKTWAPQIKELRYLMDIKFAHRSVTFRSFDSYLPWIHVTQGGPIRLCANCSIFSIRLCANCLICPIRCGKVRFARMKHWVAPTCSSTNWALVHLSWGEAHCLLPLPLLLSPPLYLPFFFSSYLSQWKDRVMPFYGMFSFSSTGIIVLGLVNAVLYLGSRMQCLWAPMRYLRSIVEPSIRSLNCSK